MIAVIENVLLFVAICVEDVFLDRYLGVFAEEVHEEIAGDVGHLAEVMIFLDERF